MRILVIAVGKVKETGLRAAIDDYAARIGRYARFEEIELKDGADDEVMARFVRAIPERAKVIALEVDGKALSSKAFADEIASAENAGVHALAFLIGGSYGLPEALSRKAHLRLSLSAMIFPHRLARLFLVEQIYRAYTILRNEPYSH